MLDLLKYFSHLTYFIRFNLMVLSQCFSNVNHFCLIFDWNNDFIIIKGKINRQDVQYMIKKAVATISSKMQTGLACLFTVRLILFKHQH